MKRCSVLLIAVALLACVSPTADAQDYPTRQVTIIVPFAPGDPADIVPRMYAQNLSDRLRNPRVVDNRALAGTAIRAAAAARARPDVDTFYLGGGTALAIKLMIH